MKAKEAADLIRKELQKRNLKFQRVRSKTVSFQDLVRARKIFVDAFGCDAVWPGDHMTELKTIARDNGFIVQFHTGNNTAI